jgi:SAM-dependent methyltransferase/predicted  nucleic acid-binding Zn-ribbon protein
MAVLNFLLPRRWKRAVGAALDAKLQSTSDSLTTRLNDTGASLLAALHEARDQLAREIAQQFSNNCELVTARLNEVRAQLENRISQQFDEICELREETYDLRQVLLSRDDEAASHRLRSAAGDVRRGLAALKNEIAAELGFGLQDMATQVADQRQWLERIEADLARLPTPLDEARNRITDHGNWLEKISFETKNLITHLDSALQTRLNTIENVELPGIADQIHEIAAAQMRFTARHADRSVWRVYPEERYALARPEPFDNYLAQARRDFPKIFDLWRDRLYATLAAFEQTKLGNAAVASDLYSRVFRDFVEIHAVGRILDIGCGVFGRPYYLGGYPVELISGLEPLPMQEPADFELVRGLAEYLPWPDGSFSTVISATSLDHCLSLERSLDEMVRVLRPDGHILLWIGSNPGSPKFEPDRSDFTPSDQFHLFHFDKAWFEPMLEAEFELLDRLELKRHGYSHIFYNIRPKQMQQREPAALRRHAAAGSN